MKTSTKALFGGALLAAGMTANAQTFMYSDTSFDGAYNSFAVSGAYSYGFVTDTAYRPDTLDTYASAYSYITGTTSAWTTQDDSSMSVNLAWDGTGVAGYGYGYAAMQQFFQVSSDAKLLLEWDFSGTDGYAFQVAFEDDAAGTELFSWILGDADTGSVMIDLSAGTDYGLIIALTDVAVTGFNPFVFNSTDTQFITATLVPAPASAGLLGLAGLAAARRRR